MTRYAGVGRWGGLSRQLSRRKSAMWIRIVLKSSAARSRDIKRARPPITCVSTVPQLPKLKMKVVPHDLLSSAD